MNTKPRRLIPPFAPLAATLLACVLAFGCSRAAMKSTPLTLWDADQATDEWDTRDMAEVGPPEDRINAWPILYYRKPALSVLWPFFALTDAGHAFVPLYEYSKEEDLLRILSVHQSLPSGATIDGKNGYWRALNAARWNNENENAFWFFPFYFGNYKTGNTLLFPLYYTAKNEFFSLLFGYHPHGFSLLGPTFFYRKAYGADGEISLRSYNFLLGLLGWWFETKPAELKPRAGWGHRALPLWYYSDNGDSTTLNIGALLFHRSVRGDGSDGFALWPLGGFGRNSNEWWNYFFPIWNAGGYEEVVEGGAVRASHFNLLGPLYHHSEDGDESYSAYAWPLRQRWEEESGVTDVLLPLYYYNRAKVGDGEGQPDERLLVTPLGGAAWGGDGRALDILGPVYISSEYPDRSYRAAAWPLFVDAREGEDVHNRLLPFYVYNKTEGVGRFYSLPYSFASDGSFQNVLGPLYHQSKEGDAWYRAILWPFVNFWGSKDESGALILPLLFQNSNAAGDHNLVTPIWQSGGTSEGDGYAGVFPIAGRFWDKRGSSFLSLPLSFGSSEIDDGVRESFFNLGTILFHRRASSLATGTYALLGMLGRTWEKPSNRTEEWVFPVYRSTSTDEESEYRVLFGLLANHRGQRGRKEDYRARLLRAAERRPELAKQLEGERGWEKFDEWSDDDKDVWNTPSEYELERTRALLGLIGRDSNLATQAKRAAEARGDDGAEGSEEPKEEYEVVEKSSGWFFPFYYRESEEGKGSRFNILWRLYDSWEAVGEDGETYERQRVLWRVYHRERQGDRVAVDMFPFIAYDEDTNLTKFSFLGGFLGYQSKEEETQLKFLWIPISW